MPLVRFVHFRIRLAAAAAPKLTRLHVSDNIFGLDSNTNDVYAATASELVQSAMEGINGSYGYYRDKGFAPLLIHYPNGLANKL
jgi:hypothetical protein